MIYWFQRVNISFNLNFSDETQSSLYERARELLKEFIVELSDTERDPSYCAFMQYFQRSNFKTTHKALIGGSDVGKTNWMLHHLATTSYDLIFVFSPQPLDYASYQCTAPNVILIPFTGANKRMIHLLQNFLVTYIKSVNHLVRIAFVHEQGDLYVKEISSHFFAKISKFYLASDLKSIPKDARSRLEAIVFFPSAKVSLLDDLMGFRHAQRSQIQTSVNYLRAHREVLELPVVNIFCDDCRDADKELCKHSSKMSKIVEIPHMQRYREKPPTQRVDTPTKLTMDKLTSNSNDNVHCLAHHYEGQKTLIPEVVDKDWLSVLVMICKVEQRFALTYECKETSLEDKSGWQAILILNDKTDGNVYCFAGLGVDRQETLQKAAKKAIQLVMAARGDH